MVWREMVSQAIRGDPAWQNGNYPKDSPPRDWINAVVPLSAIMTGSAEQLQDQGPTRATAISLVENMETGGEVYDGNDMLYDFESSADYDPAPNLGALLRVSCLRKPPDGRCHAGQTLGVPLNAKGGPINLD